jgi:peptide/nickel transport system substrate-binding protein
VLDTRDDYWGEAPGVEQVTLKYFADATATTNALQTGDVDAIANLQAPELLSSFESDDRFVVTTGTSSGEVSLSLNNRAAPFDDVRVRQAVLYALDEQAVLDTAWNGYGSLVATYATPTDPYYEDLNDVYPYDPEKAKELLKEAGQENLDITFTVPTRPYAQAVSEIVVSQLKDVGINATIKSAEFPAVWLDEVFTKHDYQMTTVLAVEARDILTVFNDPDYYIGYDNSKIAPIAAEADTADEAGYIDGMQQFARQIVDDAASGVLFLFPNITVAKAGLQGMPENAIIEALDLTNLSWQ